MHMFKMVAILIRRFNSIPPLLTNHRQRTVKISSRLLNRPFSITMYSWERHQGHQGSSSKEDFSLGGVELRKKGAFAMIRHPCLLWVSHVVWPV